MIYMSKHLTFRYSSPRSRASGKCWSSQGGLIWCGPNHCGRRSSLGPFFLPLPSTCFQVLLALFSCSPTILGSASAFSLLCSYRGVKRFFLLSLLNFFALSINLVLLWLDLPWWCALHSGNVAEGLKNRMEAIRIRTVHLKFLKL